MRIFLSFLFIISLQPACWSAHGHSYNSEHPQAHAHADHSLAKALVTGKDTDGKLLYLCLARLFNSTQPGKTWAGYGRCNVPYGGKEYIVDQFEIPSKNIFAGTYWQNNSALALTVGRESNGKPLFLCQAHFKNSQQPGKTWPGYKHCNISYAGQEVITDNYRVLANDRRGAQYHAHPDNAQQCIQSPFGSQACGYNCVQSINHVACASSPDQQCIADDFGHIACGYGCAKTATKVACAPRRDMNCVANSFNEIRCGHNCSLDRFGQIQCKR